MKYKTYLKSPEWRKRQLNALRATNYRCQMFGTKVGRYKGAYYPFNVHHHTYKNKYDEKWQRDIFVLSKEAHDLIHGWLALSRKPISTTTQDKNPYNKYPNFLQRLVHCWCWWIGWLLFILKEVK